MKDGRICHGRGKERGGAKIFGKTAASLKANRESENLQIVPPLKDLAAESLRVRWLLKTFAYRTVASSGKARKGYLGVLRRANITPRLKKGLRGRSLQIETDENSPRDIFQNKMSSTHPETTHHSAHLSLPPCGAFVCSVYNRAFLEAAAGQQSSQERLPSCVG